MKEFELVIKGVLALLTVIGLFLLVAMTTGLFIRVLIWAASAG